MTKTKKLIGGYEFVAEQEGDELVLRFPLEGKHSDGKTYHREAGLLLHGIETTFRFYESRFEREQQAKTEREGGGVDPFVLNKIRRDIDKLLVKFDNRTIRKAEQLAQAVRSFKNGDQVKVKDGVTDIGGKPAVVVGRAQKYVLVQIESKRWRVSPSLLVKQEAR